MSRPLHLTPEDLPLTTGFRRRMILADFNKTFFSELRAARPEIIIFDFAEKLDLLRWGDAFVTRSNDLLNSGFDFSAPYQFEIVNALSARASELWKSATRALAGELQTLFPGAQYVLHQVHWAQSYYDGEDLRLFDQATRLECTLYNLLLDGYSDYFAMQFSAIDILKVPEPYHARRDHKWGLSPLHYEDDFYYEALAQLRRIALAP